MVSSRSACGACTGSSDQPAKYLQATGLRFFSKFVLVRELNKIVEATMPVNPYDDDWVSLRWPNGKADLDIVRTS